MEVSAKKNLQLRSTMRTTPALSGSMTHLDKLIASNVPVDMRQARKKQVADFGACSSFGLSF